MTTTITTNNPFHIDKKRVYEAYKAVKSIAGSAGVDGQTIEQFDSDLQNLYKLWNRMSSGSYFPPPVRAVSIPIKAGGRRILGVPTVADCVAQMVVKQLIEPDLDPFFFGRLLWLSAEKIGSRCYRRHAQAVLEYDWILEFDIKGLFDNSDHELLLRAVRKHVRCKWALLYIERWLTAPMDKVGIVTERTRGTPRGGVISPILARQSRWESILIVAVFPSRLMVWKGPVTDSIKVLKRGRCWQRATR
ncbi:reverse transcriptase domain-containing protein [Bradyrhizobium sp. RT5a]|uniref:reverse transcriptase domain-containing protein n=1 Tax=unclassified Bradyrhizobium TaxID=2631580 RepID=UPI0033949956